ncbi:hypothetical protein Tco_0881359 [Tanacetum coccineum]
MANGADIAASENRGRGTFNFRMDEFYGSKVTISVQRNHREAMCEENSSNPINDLWNTVIPGPRRSTYSTGQQDNTTRMHDGLRTGSIVSRCRSSHGRKNQNGHSPGISKANYYDRLNSNIGGTKGIIGTQAKRAGRILTSQAKEERPDTRKKQSNTRGGGKIGRRQHYERSPLSQLSNPVMVKKHDDSWRMCVDFKDLNKACHKDGYPLPEID